MPPVRSVRLVLLPGCNSCCHGDSARHLGPNDVAVLPLACRVQCPGAMTHPTHPDRITPLRSLRMADRARAWYDAAYRRLAVAEAQRAAEDLSDYTELVMEHDFDTRVAIARRYARMVSL